MSECFGIKVLLCSIKVTFTHSQQPEDLRERQSSLWNMRILLQKRFSNIKILSIMFYHLKHSTIYIFWRNSDYLMDNITLMWDSFKTSCLLSKCDMWNNNYLVKILFYYCIKFIVYIKSQCGQYLDNKHERVLELKKKVLQQFYFIAYILFYL